MGLLTEDGTQFLTRNMLWAAPSPVRSSSFPREAPMTLPPPMLFHVLDSGPYRVAPFSHAVSIGPWAFITGQMPTDPKDNSLPLPQGVEAQTRAAMENLKVVLAGIGCDLAQVAFARVFLTEFQRDYAAMNAAYASYFTPGKLPART